MACLPASLRSSNQPSMQTWNVMQTAGNCLQINGTVAWSADKTTKGKQEPFPYYVLWPYVLHYSLKFGLLVGILPYWLRSTESGCWTKSTLSRRVRLRDRGGSSAVGATRARRARRGRAGQPEQPQQRPRHRLLVGVTRRRIYLALQATNIC